MSRMSFELLATDGKARRGRLTFPRGTVETPAFMPVGTYGTVKGMLPRDIVATGAEIILGNTFHLWLRPGTEVIKGSSNQLASQIMEEGDRSPADVFYARRAAPPSWPKPTAS